jgi:hypothetical protein
MYGPPKTYVNRASDARVTNHLGTAVTTYDILGIVITCICISLLLLGSIKAGFQPSGIHSFNSDICQEEESMGPMLHIDLPLLWLQQLPVATVNLQRSWLIFQDRHYARQKVTYPSTLGTLDPFLTRTQKRPEDEKETAIVTDPLFESFERKWNARLGANEINWA